MTLEQLVTDICEQLDNINATLDASVQATRETREFIAAFATPTGACIKVGGQ